MREGCQISELSTYTRSWQSRSSQVVEYSSNRPFQNLQSWYVPQHRDIFNVMKRLRVQMDTLRQGAPALCLDY